MTVQGLIEAAQALVPVLAAREATTNAVREVPAETVAALHEAGFLRVLQPRRFGGLQGSFDTFSRIVEELTAGCAASAWVYAVLGEHQWIIGCFPKQAQIDVWGDNPRAVASSSLIPRAEARVVPGGWRLSGKFPFSSGSLHAQWAIIGAFAAEPGGAKRVRYNLVPMQDIVRIDDWHTLGLRGTGSQSLRLEDVFIPEHRSVLLDDLNSGDTPGRAVHPDYPLIAAPRDYLVPFSLPSVMFGLGRRALDFVIPLLREKVARATLRLAESEVVQVNLAAAAAQLDMAHLLFDTHRTRAAAAVEAGGLIPVAQRLRSRRDIVFAQRYVRLAVESLCELAGTHMVYDDSALQSILRDVLTISTHGAANWQLAMAPYGRLMLAK